jgi:hypothetical protein
MPEFIDYNVEHYGIIDPAALVDRFRDFVREVYVIDNGDLKPYRKHIRKPIAFRDDFDAFLQEVEKFANLRNQLFKKTSLLELRRSEVSHDDNTDLLTLNQAVTKVIARSNRPIPQEFKEKIIYYHNLLAEILCKLIAGMQDPAYLLTERGALKATPVKAIEELLFLIGDDDYLNEKLQELIMVDVNESFTRWENLGELFGEYKEQEPFSGPYGIIRESIKTIVNAEPSEKTAVRNAERLLKSHLDSESRRRLLRGIEIMPEQKTKKSMHFFNLFILRLMITHLKLEAYKSFSCEKKKHKGFKSVEKTIDGIAEERIIDIRKRILCVIKSKLEADRVYGFNKAYDIKHLIGADNILYADFCIYILNSALRSMEIVTSIKNLL